VRVQAGIYLLFHTLLASLPLLVGILFGYNSQGPLCLFYVCGNSSYVGGLCLCLFLLCGNNSLFAYQTVNHTE
jgi:hypothetical protein